ncbi:MAG: D-alanine--D-alanine ligase [Microscillaceae bacterium]|nr:D-alanine--D-alanine ligase [Microscillaceae bacterium]MDW8460013.1 D-alanine--D-alanine ligase [Cytophagales bacterium]
MRIGIFFGGQSREREVSFAGGRTVYDNLNKQLFEPVPIFVDSLGNFILLEWQYLYKGTIRDFYPPISYQLQANQKQKFQIYVESLLSLETAQLEAIMREVGRPIYPHEFATLFDMAFLCLHGSYGEDGNIQGLLEWYNIPYTGAGILPSAIGIDKHVQTQWLPNNGFLRPKSRILDKKTWLLTNNKKELFEDIKQEIGLPLVVKSPKQGSSIGISIVKEDNWHTFKQAVHKSFFVQEITPQFWRNLSSIDKENFINQFTDIREGLGFPVYVSEYDQVIYTPEKLWEFLDKIFKEVSFKSSVHLLAENTEEVVLIEQWIEGKEFSCIVIEDFEGKPFALPPTEIRKFQDVFDYRSKYLPGTSRKVTPIELPIEQIEQIRQECCRLFQAIFAQVYARIDGFITQEGKIYLNDPNTTSGMLPSSFFFHQAAEIGLNPSQFLTYVLYTSLVARLREGKKVQTLQNKLSLLAQKIENLQQEVKSKIRVAVIMGGYSTERHISMESGRNVFEKLASSNKYAPFPVFLSREVFAPESTPFELYLLPINMMLKDNADDIREKILAFEQYKNSATGKYMQQIRQEAQPITQYFAGQSINEPQKISLKDLKNLADVVFIALHGRPGEDGELQSLLDSYQIPYNGSSAQTSKITINKFETNEILAKHGLKVAQHMMVYQHDLENRFDALIEELEMRFSYPCIAKPVDEGCSSAVKKIKSRGELIAYAKIMFRNSPEIPLKEAQALKLKPNEEFPMKNAFLIETLIEKGEAVHFLEITGGLLTHYTPQGIEYEIFEPSEALALGEVLSLEEKFLAGEGQNITPAVYSSDATENERISQIVKKELLKVAKILNIEGYARIDAFVKIYADKRVEVYIIEVNSLPGMTPATCIFHQAAINHYKPYHFIDKILEYALQKAKQKVSSY